MESGRFGGVKCSYHLAGSGAANPEAMLGSLENLWIKWAIPDYSIPDHRNKMAQRFSIASERSRNICYFCVRLRRPRSSSYICYIWSYHRNNLHRNTCHSPWKHMETKCPKLGTSRGMVIPPGDPFVLEAGAEMRWQLFGHHLMG